VEKMAKAARQKEKKEDLFNQILEAGRKKRLAEEIAKDMSPASKKCILDAASKEVARLVALKMVEDNHQEEETGDIINE
jgi:hypothetical protein